MEEERTKEGFVYKATSFKISQIFRFLKIWGWVIILLTVIGLLLLNYMRIVSLSDISWLHFLPQREPSYSLEVDSEIPGYRIELENKEVLIDTLKQWGVYGKVYSDPRFGDTQDEELTKITIILTDKSQPIFPFSDKEGVYASSGPQLRKGSLNLYIYLSERILVRQEEVSDFLLFQTLTSLGRIGVGSSDVPSLQKRDGEVQNFLQNSSSQDIQFLSLIRIIDNDREK